MKFGLVIETFVKQTRRQIFVLKKDTQIVVEKLFPDLFRKY